MNVVAALTSIAMPRVDVTAIGLIIQAVKAGRAASRALDADVMTALGWQVDRPAGIMRSPLSTLPLALPRISKSTDYVHFILPPEWDWSAGKKKGGGFATCGDGTPMAEGSGALWFETNARTAALALLLAALYGRRALLVDHKASPSAPLNDRFDGVQCRCDWAGPADALHHDGRCPDCGTHILIEDGA